MITKTFEIRDVGTFIPALAIYLRSDDERDNYLLRRAGFSKGPDVSVYLMHLQTEEGHYDPYRWNNSTMRNAHLRIQDGFEELTNGQVIDIQYIQGLTNEPKKSEAEL